MEKAKVYFTKEITPESVLRMYRVLEKDLPGRVAVKIHSGEEGNQNYLRPYKASIGMLQRMFKIGFNRAARIMDQLADAGVVGEEEGTKPRRILMSAEEFEAYVNRM